MLFLVHLPSPLDQPDAIFWQEDDGTLGEHYIDEDSADAMSARATLSKKVDEATWNDLFAYLDDQNPTFLYDYQLYEAPDGTDPATFLDQLRQQLSAVPEGPPSTLI